MASHFIGMAGGTGSGKSTIAWILAERYPDTITIVHLDDFYFPQTRVPRAHGMTNWDHPKGLDFDSLIMTLEKLKNGQSVPIQTHDEKASHPQEQGDGEFLRVPAILVPKPLIIVEGHLALYDARIREMFSTSFYIDLPFEQGLLRRTKFRDAIYEEKILRPMHQAYVAPTKQYAKHVISIQKLTQGEAADRIEIILKEERLL